MRIPGPASCVVLPSKFRRRPVSLGPGVLPAGMPMVCRSTNLVHCSCCSRLRQKNNSSTLGSRESRVDGCMGCRLCVVLQDTDASVSGEMMTTQVEMCSSCASIRLPAATRYDALLCRLLILMQEKKCPRVCANNKSWIASSRGKMVECGG